MSSDLPAALPLTPLQQGMLHHWLQNPQSGADVEQMVCTLQEEVDPARLRAVWEEALHRHDALRLRLDWSGAQPVQHIASGIILPWNERVITGADIPAFLHADRFAGFDLREAPLLRFTLLQVAGNDWRLIWTFHHLLLDGRSITRLLHEVFAAYDGREVDSGVRSSISRYLTWQSLLDHSPSLPFWKERLDGVHGPSAAIIDNLGHLTPLPPSGMPITASPLKPRHLCAPLPTRQGSRSIPSCRLRGRCSSAATPAKTP